MTRTWMLPALLALLLAAWAAWILATGRAYLPRHTSARDLPYALAERDVPPQPFNRVMTDPMNLVLPDLVLLKRELERGRIPIWNHGLLAGVPHAANPISGALYPPNWLVALFDPVDFLAFSACLHVLLAGTLFGLYLRAAGVRPFATLVGGLGFALSGWCSAHLHNTPLVAAVAWIPLGLAGIELAVRGHRRRAAPVIALSIAMQWLAGFPLFAAIGTLVLAVYALVSVLLAPAATPLQGRLASAGRIAVPAVLGLLLAAVLILPALEVRERAPRKGADRTVLEAESFEPGVLTGLALPFWLGDAHEKPVTEPPVEGDRDHAARHVAAALVLGTPGPDRVRATARINTFGERAVYAGAAILLLAICGAVLLRNRSVVALLVATALGGAFACGALPPDPMLRLLGLDVGAPGRGLLVLALAVPGLAAFGLDRLLDSERRGAGVVAALRLAGLSLGLGGLVAAVAAFVARDACLLGVVRLLRELGAPAALGVVADRPDAAYAADLGPAFDRLRVDVLRLGALTVAAWIAVEWARRGARGPIRPSARIAAAALPVLVVLDLGAALLRTNQPVARGGSFPSTAALDFLRDESARSRFARVSATHEAAIAEMHVLFPPNFGMIHGLADAQGYRDLVPSGVLALLEGTSALVGTGGAAGVGLETAASPVLDLMSVRWLAAGRAFDPSSEAFRRSGLEPAGAGGGDGRDLVLYENKDARPLAWPVREVVLMSDADAVAALRAGSVDVARRVILERLPDGAAAAAAGANGEDSVTARLDGDAIRVDATLASDGYVVIGAAWDPGWRATLWHGPWREDRGPSLEVLRANVAFMAVRVPKGQHTIHFRYWPRSLSAGIGCAASALVALAAFVAWPARRRAPATVTEPRAA